MNIWRGGDRHEYNVNNYNYNLIQLIFQLICRTQDCLGIFNTLNHYVNELKFSKFGRLLERLYLEIAITFSSRACFTI